MKQRLNLCIEKEVYNFIKARRINISRYVEKLLINDMLNKQPESFAATKSIGLVPTRVQIPTPSSIFSSILHV
ncbi:MAG: type II toxin-antitoxin system CcdA family antitoxin [archaeon]